ncbi:uncharacterized protein LOC134468731 [Engraulis encrasicolus]|uniref:uncharacterized protein LOC134468731 n=1 Tax=Engraulis encrasicolus TaxID=184585 RepID=UPI002FCF926C
MASPTTASTIRGQCVFGSLEALNSALSSHEEETISKFVTLRKEKDFGQRVENLSSEKKVYWDLKHVPYDGMPFHLVGTKTYTCHLGPDQNVKAKERYCAKKEKQALEDHVFMPRYQQVQRTKKMDCPAQFTVYQIIKFPAFRIKENIKSNRRAASAALKNAIEADASMAAELREPIDPRVKDQIVKLTLAGVRTVDEIRRHLATFVADELFRGEKPPPPTRHRFYPTDADIRNMMTRTRDGTRGANDDQANLQILTSKWTAEHDCKIHYRPSQVLEDGTTTKLLFCYQTAWQQRLLSMYGQHICLLDATYRTCRYSLPIFFICVRTNVCYLVVGVFVTQTETTAAVSEALGVIKGWNPSWSPDNFMVDFCQVEIAALGEVFPDTNVLLCDFHREKAWRDWCWNGEHGVRAERDSLLQLLRDVATASTQEEYVANMTKLQDSAMWRTNEKLRNWFGRKWIPEAKRWVRVFRDEQLKIPINTNNGVERQNKTFKQLLQGHKNCSLSDMLTVVTSTFLPRSYQKYVQLNVAYSSAYRRYNTVMPGFLHNRPRGVVTHIMERMTEAEYHTDEIVPVGDGLFNIKSASHGNGHHTVDFGCNTDAPSCTCMDWRRSKLPCKHFCAIFLKNKEWGWEKLHASYRENPLLSLDGHCLPGEGEDDISGSQLPHTPSTSSPPSPSQSPPSPSQSPPSPSQSPPSPSQSPPPSPVYCDLPARRQHCVKQLRTECGSLLREITNLTYNIQDEENLRALKSQLQDLQHQIQQYTPRDDCVGLPLDADQIPKKRRRAGSPEQQLASLPVYRAPRKNPFTNRVGHHAEVMRRNYNTTIE